MTRPGLAFPKGRMALTTRADDLHHNSQWSTSPESFLPFAEACELVSGSVDAAEPNWSRTGRLPSGGVLSTPETFSRAVLLHRVQLAASWIGMSSHSDPCNTFGRTLMTQKDSYTRSAGLCIR